MSDHPDVAELLDRWEDVALTHSTWIALSRMLNLSVEREETESLTIDEITDMVRAGVCFVMQALPDIEFRSRDDAAYAMHAVAAAIDAAVACGANYDLDAARELARREAYGL